MILCRSISGPCVILHSWSYTFEWFWAFESQVVFVNALLTSITTLLRDVKFNFETFSPFISSDEDQLVPIKFRLFVYFKYFQRILDSLMNRATSFNGTPEFR